MLEHESLVRLCVAKLKNLIEDTDQNRIKKKKEKKRKKENSVNQKKKKKKLNILDCLPSAELLKITQN